MKETVILAPSLNGTELSRTLARFGKSTVGLRAIGGAELARLALMRSGTPIKEDFLPRGREAAVIDSFIRESEYFASASFADSQNLANALYSLRSFGGADEKELFKLFGRGEFPDKNLGMTEIFEKYNARLSAEGLIDTVGLIRRATELKAPVLNELFLISELPPSPLESRLAEAVAEKVTEISLSSLFEREPASVKGVTFLEGYGASCEVEAVFRYIADRNLPFDRCTVVTAGAEYARLFYDMACTKGIKVTFGSGLPILLSNPARLLKALHRFNTDGYNGIDALYEVISCDAFDRTKLYTVLGTDDRKAIKGAVEKAGALRLGFDGEENARRIERLKRITTDERELEAIALTEKLSRELSLGYCRFTEKYSLLRKDFAGKLDRSALSVICEGLDAYARFSAEGDPEEIITELMKRSVCSELSRDGALFVTTVDGGLSSVRENLFVVGLSASNFPGSPRENYLLPDSDYILACEGELPTSANIIKRKKEALMLLLRLASALGVRIRASYSGYDPATLKTENPSSVIFDIFKEQNGAASTVEELEDATLHAGFFTQSISPTDPVGRAYNSETPLVFHTESIDLPPSPVDEERAYSPSALDKFFECPRRFFFRYVLGFPETEEDDPFTVISPAETGTLAHKIMEQIAEARPDEESFMKLCRRAFDEHLVGRPPIHEDSAERERFKFLQMMKNAYLLDPQNKVLSAEEEQKVLHAESGVLIRGFPDRVEEISDGRLVIADYKTGVKVRHVENDINTCLQVVIYAYIMEQKGRSVSHCEYRYLRDGITVSCRYDEEMKSRLTEKLQTFKKALDTGVFPAEPQGNGCDYCSFADLCEKCGCGNGGEED